MGVIPSQVIRRMLGIQVHSCIPFDETQIQPGSFDLRCSGRIWRVPAPFKAVESSILDRLEEFSKDYESWSLYPGQWTNLIKGQTYIVELCEGLELPDDIFAKANPKSSTGRVDVFTRLLVEGSYAYDHVPFGYKGKLYAVVCPKSFDVRMSPGISLNQLRFFRNSRDLLNDQEIKQLHEEHGLAFDKEGSKLPISSLVIKENALFLRIDLSEDIVGYRAKKSSDPIHLDKKGHHDKDDHFDVEKRPRSGMRPVEDAFYIMASKERVRIPRGYSAEMVEFHSGLAEARFHYAGFFDECFGDHNLDGIPLGGTAVAEARFRDSGMILDDGDLFFKLEFERMEEPSDKPYGSKPGTNNYQGQVGLRLSKHFK